MSKLKKKCWKVVKGGGKIALMLDGWAIVLPDTPKDARQAEFIVSAPEMHDYIETTVEVLRLVLSMHGLPENARECLRKRIDEAGKIIKKA